MEEIAPQPGPQTLAARSQADILFYGGQAGGGKTWFLAYELAKHAHIPGYVGVIMRKNLTQLTGPDGAWAETERLYPLLQGHGTQSPHLKWEFPSGAKIFGKHLERESLQALEHAWQGNSAAYVGIDEATQFQNEASFWYSWGRCRTKCGIKPRMRATCNPHPDSWVRPLVDWWIDDDGFAIPERSGQIRYLFRDPKGDLIWSATRAEALAKAPSGYDPDHDIVSFTFVHADIRDNQKLLEQDPGYIARLRTLPLAERARMLDGNWNVRPTRGDFFQRGSFRALPRSRLELALGQYPDLQTQIVKKVRCYDFAATPVQGNTVPGLARPEGYRPRQSGTRADWTASVLLAECRPPKATRNVGPRYVILDVQRYQDTPGAIRQWVQRQAEIDGPQTRIALFRDPGQAGLDQLEGYKRALRHLTRVYALPTVAPGTKPSGGSAKQLNAKPVSEVVFDGRMFYSQQIPEDRLNAFFNEIESFPDTDRPPSERAPDDQVDAFSGAFRALHELPSSAWGTGAISTNPETPHLKKDSSYWLNIRPRRDTDQDDPIHRPGGTVGFERGF